MKVSNPQSAIVVLCNFCSYFTVSGVYAFFINFECDNCILDRDKYVTPQNWSVWKKHTNLPQCRHCWGWTTSRKIWRQQTKYPWLSTSLMILPYILFSWRMNLATTYLIKRLWVRASRFRAASTGIKFLYGMFIN